MPRTLLPAVSHPRPPWTGELRTQRPPVGLVPCGGRCAGSALPLTSEETTSADTDTSSLGTRAALEWPAVGFLSHSLHTHISTGRSGTFIGPAPYSQSAGARGPLAPVGQMSCGRPREPDQQINPHHYGRQRAQPGKAREGYLLPGSFPAPSPHLPARLLELLLLFLRTGNEKDLGLLGSRTPGSREGPALFLSQHI